MGIAYSPPDQVVHVEFPAHTSECIRTALHTAVQMAGWVVDQALPNGYVYLLTSPQDASLQCKVKIEDTGRTSYLYSGIPLVDLTWMTVDELKVSQPLGLKYIDAVTNEPEPRKLRAHIGPCQIFTYYPHQLGGGNAVMGGIPFIDPNALDSTVDRCADEDNDLQTIRAWWCCGDLENLYHVYAADSLRSTWAPIVYSTLHNNDLVTPAAFHHDPVLRLIVTGRADHFWSAYGRVNDDVPLMMRWMGTDEPLCFDPLIAWNTVHPVKVRGQLWDAFIRAKFVPWESPLAFDALPWFSYSCGDPQEGLYSTGDIYTLYLRDPGLTLLDCDGVEPPEVPGSNYVY